jgi:hypothetical protein
MHVSEGLLGFPDTDPPKLSRLNSSSKRITENNISVLYGPEAVTFAHSSYRKRRRLSTEGTK